MYERSERYKNPLKRSFRKPEKATVSVMFGKLCFVLVLGPLGPRFMMSVFSTANEGQGFDLHMNNIQKNYCSYLYSRLRDGIGCAARTVEPEYLMPSKQHTKFNTITKE